ncbi:hypothetical protein QO010_001265 [Caulobacter ginsengisoli]|uniref:Flp pilus-assembly TadG-like N-terminal domain-containing protein n=1 Tax=Caulobacter ginsengisoli TaxID=400775 RepID=A0ABU0INB8_9CAUL|nr:hypothetical protein [Caulobacter ginsengisoli]MDQ0463494.1 hypothetical protein [Caulobacter ginsengisoli]
MTNPRKAPGTGRRWVGVVLTAAALAAPVIAFATAADLYYERTVMAAADARCRLFTPEIGSALAAAQAQARGAALRSGVDEASLADTARRARAKVVQVGCGSKDIAVAAGRVRTAFEEYARINRLNYPGDTAAWAADRTPREYSTWRLAQPVSFGWDRMVFGLAGRTAPGSLTAVVSFADGATPYTARLVMRDTTRLNHYFIDPRRSGAGGRAPLASRLPPRSMSLVFAALSRTTAPIALLPRQTKAALSFGFPDSAAQALAGLDPREAVMVEFVFAGRSGDTVRQAYIEVGDFAAGKAFLTLAQR